MQGIGGRRGWREEKAEPEGEITKAVCMYVCVCERLMIMTAKYVSLTLLCLVPFSRKLLYSFPGTDTACPGAYALCNACVYVYLRACSSGSSACACTTTSLKMQEKY